MSLEATIEISGIEENIAYFESVGIHLQDHVSEKLREVSQVIVNYAYQIAPKKTGDYAASIHYRQDGPLRFIIVAGDKKAAIIEFGSISHFIIPRFKKCLRWVVDGEEIFAKWVLHPGTAPQLIIHRAKKAHMNRIVEAITEGVQEALEHAGR